MQVTCMFYLIEATTKDVVEGGKLVAEQRPPWLGIPFHPVHVCKPGFQDLHCLTQGSDPGHLTMPVKLPGQMMYINNKRYCVRRCLCSPCEFNCGVARHNSGPPEKLQQAQPMAFHWTCNFLPALDLAVLAHQWRLPIPLPQQAATAAGKLPFSPV